MPNQESVVDLSEQFPCFETREGDEPISLERTLEFEDEW
jgi:hypothetical protein